MSQGRQAEKYEVREKSQSGKREKIAVKRSRGKPGWNRRLWPEPGFKC